MTAIDGKHKVLRHNYTGWIKKASQVSQMGHKFSSLARKWEKILSMKKTKLGHVNTYYVGYLVKCLRFGESTVWKRIAYMLHRIKKNLGKFEQPPDLTIEYLNKEIMIMDERLLWDHIEISLNLLNDHIQRDEELDERINRSFERIQNGLFEMEGACERIRMFEYI